MSDKFFLKDISRLSNDKETEQLFCRHKAIFFGKKIIGKEIYEPKLALNKYLKSIS